MATSFITIFTSAFHDGWWALWIRFGLSVIFGMIGIFSVYRLSSFQMKIFLWWSIFVVCIDIITAVYETTFYDEICEGEYSEGSDDFNSCINKTSKIITVSIRIVSIVLEAYFVFVTRKFIKLLNRKLSSNDMYFDIEDSSKQNFHQVTPLHEAQQSTLGDMSSLNLGITSVRESQLAEDQDLYSYVPPTIPIEP